MAPLDAHDTLLAFKKGPQGLSVSFTIQVGKNDQTSEVTTVYYTPTRLNFALAIPADATDVVFDENRPYLSGITAGSTEATLDFYRKELTALGWSPLTAADAVKQWPNAKLDEKIANGAAAYFIRGTQRPIVLALQSHDGNKTAFELKVPSFAAPQTLEASQPVFGLPIPKSSKTSGGTGGDSEHSAHAHVAAEVGTVLEFYRRELTARNWKEETQGAVVKPDDVTLNFTAPEGPAVLKLSHKYDLTIVSLVLHLQKPAVAKAVAAAQGDSVDALLKQAQQMMREATTDLAAGTRSPAAPPPPPKAAGSALRVLADNKASVPVPDSAEDVEFDGADGSLEFTTTSPLQSVADFYRTAMKEQGWNSQSSVINNANMVVLNFAKAGKTVSFTLMRMGNTTKVSGEGSALKLAAARAIAAPAPVQAGPEDLEAEESGGLPVPKRHTMSEGTKTPFRRELQASVPLELTDVLGFYRRELGKLNWKEDAKGTTIGDDSAAVTFTAPEGPAVRP